jgi:hypothetical protein
MTSFNQVLSEVRGILAIITTDLIAKIAKYMRYYLLNILPLNFNLSRSLVSQERLDFI